MDQPSFIGIITKDEATAAQRTFTFLAVDITDGFTPETTLVYAGADCQISKNGGALGNLAGAVTEISAGLYKVVLAAGDVDTLGTFLISFADAAARTVYVQGQVVAFDLNTATVALTAGSIVAATFGAAAIDAAAIAPDAIAASELAATAATEVATAVAASSIGTGLATVIAQTTPTKVTGPHSLGTRTTDGVTSGISLRHSIEATLNVAGTFNGATASVEVCADVNATVPVWTAYVDALAANPRTTAGDVIVSGPHDGVRWRVTDDGASTDLDFQVSAIRSLG